MLDSKDWMVKSAPQWMERWSCTSTELNGLLYIKE